MFSFLQKLNVFNACKESRLGLWECPPFLFIIMGVVNIITVVAVYIFAARIVEEPEIAALVVIFVSALIFLVGNLLIAGFNKISEANRMKSEFLNIVSHQLRTPLSVFKWTAELLEKEKEGGRRAKYLASLTDYSNSMVRLVNLLLDVSRIEAGRFFLRRSVVSLVQLTNDSIRALAPYAKSSGVKIDFQEEGEVNVLADAERLGMVIQNLIDNAIRYSSEAGVIKVAIESINKNQVEWRIEDRGVGIPRDQQKYIFQKFFRATNGAVRQTRGSGLGLYIARAVIKELGGSMGFISEEGKGSTFWFRLSIYK